MRQVTEQQILALAPNPAAVSNGQKISRQGGFVKLAHSADDSFYMGECKGSGKSNYITTIDYIDEAQPVFRCSCPSRQFPCKHSLGLLYDIVAGKTFETCEIPEDILSKRTKKQNRAEKAEAAASEDAPKKKAASGAASKAARTKKLKKQLEGLELTSKLMSDLLAGGLGAMGGAALPGYKQLAKQLGDYYLPGPQLLLNRLINEIAAFQNDSDDVHYERAVNILERLGALVKKATQYLTTKLKSEEVTPDDSLLYEELGGAWKLSELSELGLSKKDARLLQLAFWINFDEAAASYVDMGCWVDLATGELGFTENYRPVKALKYIKQEDSNFDVATVPEVCYYPGEGNKRIRWEGFTLQPMEQADLKAILNGAAPALAPVIKEAKNILKNPLSSSMVAKLIKFRTIGTVAEGIALEDEVGDRVLLGDIPDMEATVIRLSMLPDSAFLHDQALLGLFFYDNASGRLKLQPLSIITAEQIVRLLY